MEESKMKYIAPEMEMKNFEIEDILMSGENKPVTPGDLPDDDDF